MGKRKNKVIQRQQLLLGGLKYKRAALPSTVGYTTRLQLVASWLERTTTSTSTSLPLPFPYSRCNMAVVCGLIAAVSTCSVFCVLCTVVNNLFFMYCKLHCKISCILSMSQWSHHSRNEKLKARERSL